MKKIISILFILSLTNCSNFKDSNLQFNRFIDDYIKKYPLTQIHKINEPLRIGEKRIFTYPSYHILFNKNKGKAQLIIKALPHYTNSSMTIANDSLHYVDQKAKGSFLYKNKYPIIVFDPENISSKYMNYKLSNIPDSLMIKERYLGLKSKFKIYYFNK